MYAKYVKRILDLILSLIALIILMPIMIIIGIVIKIDSKGSIFFLQERLGKYGRVFKIIKFRTMVVNAEHIGDGLKVKSEQDNRITKVGKFLRKTSLDELPQLFNILKGEMALIGPRPPVTYYPHKYKDYSKKQRRRFLVLPGITGLAQVRVRNSATWDERIKIDIEYIDKITFKGDLKILLNTIKNIIKKQNIYEENRKVEEMEKKENVRVS